MNPTKKNNYHFRVSPDTFHSIYNTVLFYRLAHNGSYHFIIREMIINEWIIYIQLTPSVCFKRGKELRALNNGRSSSKPPSSTLECYKNNIYTKYYKHDRCNNVIIHSPRFFYYILVYIYKYYLISILPLESQLLFLCVLQAMKWNGNYYYINIISYLITTTKFFSLWIIVC